MAQELSAKMVAEKFETTPRTLRKFLRADAKASGTVENLPGKGGRYSFQTKQLKSLQKRFDAWSAARAEATEDAVEDATEEVVTEDETE